MIVIIQVSERKLSIPKGTGFLGIQGQIPCDAARQRQQDPLVCWEEGKCEGLR